jgi:hypothetical protein
MYVKLSWRPEVDENWAIMVVQPSILTYPTMALYFWLDPLPVRMAARKTKYLNKYVRRGLCLIYISSFYFWSPPLARKMRIKQRHVQTFWGIIHVCQAILETGSGPKLSHNGCTAANFDLHVHGFLLLTWFTGPMEWSTGRFTYVFTPFRSPWRPK